MTVLAATSALKEVLVHLNNRASLASATVGVYLVVVLEIEAGVSPPLRTTATTLGDS